MRARLGFALVLGLALIGGSIALVTTAGDEPAMAAAAPAECLRDWNTDVVARENGRHGRSFHRYEEAQVGYLDPTGGTGAVSSDPAAGACAVVFPRSQLDPEIEFAGFIEVADDWEPLSETLTADALTALQSRALTGANVTLTAEGQLEATS